MTVCFSQGTILFNSNRKRNSDNFDTALVGFHLLTYM